MTHNSNRFRSLRWKINSILASGTGAVAIGGTLVLAYVLTGQLKEGLEKKAKAIAALLAENLSANIEFDDTTSTESMLIPLKADAEFSFVVISKQDGTDFFTQGKVPGDIERLVRKKSPDPMLERQNIITIFKPILNEQQKRVGQLAIGYSTKEILERSTKIQLIGILACIILIAIIMAYFAYAMNRTVVKPIKNLIAFVQRIGEGDLRENDSEGDTKETLEIQLMREALQSTTMAFRANVNAIQLSAKDFSAIADDLFASSTYLSNVAKRQVDGINEAFSTAKRMEAAGEENASNALDISGTAETSVEVSGHGRTVVKDSVDQFHSVREQVQTIVDAVDRLNSQLSQIDAIIQSVADVAKQSQLLAVNASIEAAKAGEAGLRFAVVAKEIKHLAAHSRDATDSVRKTLGNVKKGIRNIAEASEDGRKRVSRGMISIENSGKVINRLAAVIKNTAEAAKTISDNTHQQVDGLKEMSSAMYQIDDLSKGNLGSVTKIKKYGETLNTKAREMEILVSKFRLN